ncbi:Type III secretion inner membrane protein [Oxalobacteraceae bacterium IMCC9480]|jgi:type III secretion protein U|nr:Type III secretion inner membrane protein [Oxalobacteraceae bacterium IMCC9480]NDP58245.1 EscU/YscU/HrcU family type III secretion system export apparatus switch protein [Oxalobacteraceae bacterium]
MSEKTEQPTDKKLEDAREKGQVPVSRDMARLATFFVIGLLAFVTEKLWHASIDSLFELAFLRIGAPFVPAMYEMVTVAGKLLLVIFGAIAITGTVVAIMAFWGQFGILLSAKALEPKLDKLNPVQGMMQLFSKRKLVELVVSLAKAVLIGYVLYLVILDQLPTILKLSGGTPRDVYYGFVEMLFSIFKIAVGICFAFSLVDLVSQRHFHTKSLMMSMDEIKREYKESEGDPLVKGTRKQLAQEWANEEPASRTQDANAVVVNPTHFAVALFYDFDAPSVPMVLAKGKDETAHAMIARAHQYKIPVIRHVWLARTLYATAKPDHPIPKASYESVAHVYAVIQEMRDNGDFKPLTELETYGDPPTEQ